MQTTTPLFNLRVGVPEMSLPVNVDAAIARRKVNGWCSEFVSTTCGGRTPELVVKDGVAYWRVPIVFTRINVGIVGDVGEMFINAQTGELENATEQLGRDFHANAVELSRRVPALPFAIRKAPNTKPLPHA